MVSDPFWGGGACDAREGTWGQGTRVKLARGQGDMGTRGQGGGILTNRYREAKRQESKMQIQKFRAGAVKVMPGMHDPRTFIR